jgi:hypothetical protein
MIRLIIILFLIFDFKTNVESQVYSDSLSDSLVNDFIKQNRKYLGGSMIDAHILKWDNCNLYYDFKVCIKNEFVKLDTDKIITDSLLTDFQSKFQSLKHVDLFVDYKNKTGNKKFCKISIPLISSNGKYAIIKYGYFCGDECGYGGIFLFEKRKNRWIKIDYRCKGII